MRQTTAGCFARRRLETIFLALSVFHCGRTTRQIVVKFGRKTSSISRKILAKLHPNIMYHFRAPSILRQTDRLMFLAHLSAFNKPQRTNGTIDSHEILHECVVYFGQDSQPNFATIQHTVSEYGPNTRNLPPAISSTIFLATSVGNRRRTTRSILPSFGTNTSSTLQLQKIWYPVLFQ